MYQCMITFRSVTPAQRGDGLLRRAGIRCFLRRTPRRMEQQGCGYSLHISCEDVNDALSILKSNQVPYRKVYRLGQKGETEEMVL